MKLFKSKQPKSTILFVYTENAARSQMAGGFFRKYALEGFQAISAGTKPVAARIRVSHFHTSSLVLPEKNIPCAV